MEETTCSGIAECLERLAAQDDWNGDVWQQCYNLVNANCENELVRFVYDDVVHYDGMFHSRNIFGFRVKPMAREIEDYRYEFRSIAAALRSRMSLSEAKKKFGL